MVVVSGKAAAVLHLMVLEPDLMVVVEPDLMVLEPHLMEFLFLLLLLIPYFP